MSRSIRLVSSKIPSQVVRLALLALFPLMAMPWTAGAQSQDPYRQLKYVENQIPPPPAYTVLPVLSVDAKLGRISCPLVSRRVWLGGLKDSPHSLLESVGCFWPFVVFGHIHRVLQCVYSFQR